MKSKVKFPLFLLIATVIVFSCNTFALADSNYPAIQRLTDGWEYQWVETIQTDTRIPETRWKETENVKELDIPRDGSEILYLRNTLPDLVWDDPAIFISFMYGTFEVYQGNQLIYQFGEIPQEQSNTYIGYNRRHIIHLDEENPSKELIIRSYSSGSLIGVAGAVSVGSQAAYLTQMFQDDADKVVIGSISMFISLIAFIFWIRKWDMVYLAFAASACAAALYAVSLTGVKQLFVDYPYVWLYVFQFAVFFRPVFDLIIIDKLFGAGYKKWVRRLWQFHLILAVTALLFTVLNPDSFTWTKGIFEKLSALEVLIMLGIVIRIFFKHTAAKVYAFGFLAMAGLMVRDLLVFTGVIYLERFYLLGHIGQFILVLAVAFILMKREYSRDANYH